MVVDVYQDEIGSFEENLRMSKIKAGKGKVDDGRKRKREKRESTGSDDSKENAINDGNVEMQDASFSSKTQSRYISEDAAVLATGHEYNITCCAFSDDDSMFATGDSFGHIMLHVT